MSRCPVGQRRVLTLNLETNELRRLARQASRVRYGEDRSALSDRIKNSKRLIRGYGETLEEHDAECIECDP